MARVLIGWELGAGTGHLNFVAQAARALQANGHQVTLALQHRDGFGLDVDLSFGFTSAPRWPGLDRRIAGAKPDATIGDTLARFGLDEPGCVARLIREWDQILAATMPDLVVAQFAPALLLAARGRVASVQIGTGYSCPPGHSGHFRRIGAQTPAFDEARLLATLNHELADSARAPLSSLPEIFAADHDLVCSLALLDPYASDRIAPRAAPLMRAAAPARVATPGDEVFVYGSNDIAPDDPFWLGLARSGLPIRIHVAQPSTALRAHCAALGLDLSAAPQPMATIAARSRLLVSHGSHGFVCAALFAGLPQMIVYFDLEKQLSAAAVQRAGLGAGQHLGRLIADPFARSLCQLYDDAPRAQRCRDAAQQFHAEAGYDAIARIVSLADAAR